MLTTSNILSLRGELKRLLGIASMAELAIRAGYRPQTFRTARCRHAFTKRMLRQVARVLRVDVSTATMLLALPWSAPRRGST